MFKNFINCLGSVLLMAFAAPTAHSATISGGVFPTGLSVIAPTEDVTQSSAITVAGLLDVAGQNVTLDNAGNDFQTVDVRASGFLTIVDTDGLGGGLTGAQGVSLTGGFVGPSLSLSRLVSGGDATITNSLLGTIDVGVNPGDMWSITGDLIFRTNSLVNVILAGKFGGIELLRSQFKIGGSILVVDFNGNVTATSPAPVPLPPASVLLLAGLITLPMARRRRG